MLFVHPLPGLGHLWWPGRSDVNTYLGVFTFVRLYMFLRLLRDYQTQRLTTNNARLNAKNHNLLAQNMRLCAPRASPPPPHPRPRPHLLLTSSSRILAFKSSLYTKPGRSLGTLLMIFIVTGAYAVWKCDDAWIRLYELGDDETGGIREGAIGFWDAIWMVSLTMTIGLANTEPSGVIAKVIRCPPPLHHASHHHHLCPASCLARLLRHECAPSPGPTLPPRAHPPGDHLLLGVFGVGHHGGHDHGGQQGARALPNAEPRRSRSAAARRSTTFGTNFHYPHHRPATPTARPDHHTPLGAGVLRDRLQKKIESCSASFIATQWQLVCIDKGERRRPAPTWHHPPLPPAPAARWEGWPPQYGV